MQEKCIKHVVVVEQGDTRSAGIIVGEDMVATSSDIVDSKDKIFVRMGREWGYSGVSYQATVYDDSHKDRDVCLLNVGELPGAPVETRDFGELQIREEVFAFTFRHDKKSDSISDGPNLICPDGVIISRRKKEDISYIQVGGGDSFFVDNASGGGVFDTKGKLVGLLSRKIAGEDEKHLAFAIPLDFVLDS